MNYTQYYENQITQKIDQEERKLWQEFYTKRLPKRTEKLKRKYTGRPEELQKTIEEFETRAAGEYSEVIDEKLTTICGEMREKFYHEILVKLDQLSAGMPDKADSPKLDNQTIASEIITGQEAEIEKLKAELQDKQENLDICAGLADRYMYRQRIVERTLKLKDEKLLKCAYTYMKKLTEGEE